jgi:hypothetical protein
MKPFRALLLCIILAMLMSCSTPAVTVTPTTDTVVVQPKPTLDSGANVIKPADSSTSDTGIGGQKQPASNTTDNADEIRSVIKTIFYKITHWNSPKQENSVPE